jgi:hypothetical protein
MDRRLRSKQDASYELQSVIKEYDLRWTSVGREISGDPNFLHRLNDPSKTISTNTLDNVWRFILKVRGQLELDLEEGN